MRAAGLALACVAIGGGVAIGYVAADRESVASLKALDFLTGRRAASQEELYPHANRDGKHDRLAPLRSGRADAEQRSNLSRRGDLLRQSHAAVDPVAPAPQPLIERPPLPKPRPKVLQSSYTLLSDLQIDAIKTRLKLTTEQERNWPAVEVALRGLAVRLHAMRKTGEEPTDLPQDSAEVESLKAAATPFVAQLNAEQKRELRMLGHVIGLGKVMAQL